MSIIGRDYKHAARWTVTLSTEIPAVVITVGKTEQTGRSLLLVFGTYPYRILTGTPTKVWGIFVTWLIWTGQPFNFSFEDLEKNLVHTWYTNLGGRLLLRLLFLVVKFPTKWQYEALLRRLVSASKLRLRHSERSLFHAGGVAGLCWWYSCLRTLRKCLQLRQE